MFIKFENYELSLSEIQKNRISHELLAEHEYVVIQHIRDWISNKTEFTFHTSGSTGEAKLIRIPRWKILYSCKASLSELDPDKKFKSSLLCLNANMIGGAMVIFRALVHNMDLRVVKAQSNPFNELDENETFDLVSMVPLQVQQLKTEELDKFHTVLIGGAPLENFKAITKARVYSTFGMTETVSHFALKKIDKEYFECIGDAKIVPNKEGILSIRGTITENRVLETNDVVNPLSSTKFIWVGRSDFIINSGGIKIIPERIERLLKKNISSPFIISSVPDKKLGNKLILVVETENQEISIDFSDLSKYEIPKKIYTLPLFPLTKSGKVNRIETRKQVLARYFPNISFDLK